ncbi:MAG: penicillin-binding protein activator [Alphaproteobacteria bacterium]|nr:penicillin-binding protein activator [Alphaproteobacteria bacterium]
MVILTGALMSNAIVKTAYAQPDSTILNLSDSQNSLSQPSLSLTPYDEQTFQEFLLKRDGVGINNDNQNPNQNFSTSAAKKRLSQNDGELRIGIILPETKLEKLVELMHNAAQMALFDSNKQNTKLFFYNIGETDSQLNNVVKQVTRDNIDIILGPLFAESVSKIAPLVGKIGLPIIAFSNSEAIAETGTYVFGLTPAQQAKQIINYALANGSKKIAIFTPENDYGRLVTQTVKNELAKYNKELAYLTYYDEDSTDLSQQVRQFTHYDYRKSQLNLHKKQVAQISRSRDAQAMKDIVAKIKRLAPPKTVERYETLSDRNVIRSELSRLDDLDTVSGPPFDAVLMVVGSSRLLQTIISLFAFYDLNTQNVTIYGLQLWDEMRRLASDPALSGALHVSIDSPRYQDFRRRYRQLFGKTAPTLVSLVYDATSLALTIGKDGNINPAHLHVANGYSGVGSHFRLLENGTVERLYSIKRISGKNSKLVQIAPTKFPDDY